MHGHQQRGRDGRQRPFDEQSAGGRSERHAQQRDQEQLRAGYRAIDWERDASHYRNTHSEPHWDPGVHARDQRGQHWSAQKPGRYEPSGFPQGLRPAGSRDWDSRHDWETERELREPRHHSELGQRIEDAGRKLIGKVKGLVRSPKNYKRSDERIREDICDRLSVSPDVDPSEVEVAVSAGEVTLSGTVANRQMKFVAEDIADDVPGVHEIHNQLRVQRAAPANTNFSQQEAPAPSSPTRNIGRS